MKQHFKKRWFNWSIKTLLALLLAWAIYQQVFAKENAADIWQSFRLHFRASNRHWLWLNIALIPVNWLLEAMKWRRLTRAFANYSLWRTYLAVLAGVTVGIFTPNRVGEYGGRMLLVKAKHNWRAVISTMVGSLAQLLVLLSAGLLGGIYFVAHYLKMPSTDVFWLLGIGSFVIIVMAWCFFKIRYIIFFFRKFSFSRHFTKYIKQLEVLEQYEAKDLSIAIGYSILRYLTYSTQYYLMLRFFGIEVSALTAYSGIATIYLIQSSIPLPPYLDLLARGEVALFVWSVFTTDEIAILGSTFTLFVLNLVVPSLFGLLIIFRTNVARSLGYRKRKVK